MILDNQGLNYYNIGNTVETNNIISVFDRLLIDVNQPSRLKSNTIALLQIEFNYSFIYTVRRSLIGTFIVKVTRSCQIGISKQEF